MKLKNISNTFNMFSNFIDNINFIIRTMSKIKSVWNTLSSKTGHKNKILSFIIFPHLKVLDLFFHYQKKNNKNQQLFMNASEVPK